MKKLDKLNTLVKRYNNETIKRNKLTIKIGDIEELREKLYDQRELTDNKRRDLYDRLKRYSFNLSEKEEKALFKKLIDPEW